MHNACDFLDKVAAVCGRGPLFVAQTILSKTGPRDAISQSNTNLTTTNGSALLGPNPIVGTAYAVTIAASDAAFFRLMK